MLDELKNLGVDIDAGLNRFMGNRALYEKYLKKFPDTLKVNPLEVLNTDGPKAAAEVVHSLKGSTGNLSIDILFNAYSEILGLLHDGQVQEARIALLKISRTQNAIVECIKKHCC